VSSYFFSTSLHSAGLPSVPFWERLQHNIPLWAYQSCSVRNDFSSLTLRLTTPPQKDIPSATVIIWVSQYDHELTTLPRVYSSRSCVCPLFHPRNHALLLHESLALSLKSPSSSPPLPMGAAHLKVDPYMSWYCEYYNAFTELTTLTRVNSFSEPAHALLLLHSSRVLMLHKSHTYCPRQMSFSSLIFSMGAISMKVNPVFFSILIIATSLAIHLSTHI